MWYQVESKGTNTHTHPPSRVVNDGDLFRWRLETATIRHKLRTSPAAQGWQAQIKCPAGLDKITHSFFTPFSWPLQYNANQKCNSMSNSSFLKREKRPGVFHYTHRGVCVRESEGFDRRATHWACKSRKVCYMYSGWGSEKQMFCTNR